MTYFQYVSQLASAKIAKTENFPLQGWQSNVTIAVVPVEVCHQKGEVEA